MAATLSYAFWQPRRHARTADSTTRCRPKRMRTSAILCPPQACVNFQVKTFRLFGKLRRTYTEVHNTLPDIHTIQTERRLTSFDEKRHRTPEDADYDEFYRCLASSVTSLPHSRAGTVHTRCSSRSRLSPQHSAFTLTPTTTRHHHHPAPPTTASARSVGESSTHSGVLPHLKLGGYSGMLTPGTQPSSRQMSGDRASITSVGKSTASSSKALSVLTDSTE